MPEYFKINTGKYFHLPSDYFLEIMKKEADAKLNPIDSTFTILSKSKGWLLVDKNNINRRKPLESVSHTNKHLTSEMSPTWMRETAKA